MQNDGFTASLEKAQGLGFIDKILPELKSYQKRFNPQGAGMNKSPTLLRNTFNLELFRFFNKKNKEHRQLKNDLGRLEA
jgi:hypothetical protein